MSRRVAGTADSGRPSAAADQAQGWTRSWPLIFARVWAALDPAGAAVKVRWFWGVHGPSDPALLRAAPLQLHASLGSRHEPRRTDLRCGAKYSPCRLPRQPAKRKCVEEVLGWMKTTGSFRRMHSRNAAGNDLRGCRLTTCSASPPLPPGDLV